ncbi:phenylacetate--CoA ligase family protein [Marinimicrobium sp. C2-29]|uniref:phenylacetate--CoA ligase family protein n=1 Tax=Marinimicrobium sp. C2-29 TaxID=3139825 RepID=UPI003138C49C
MNSLDKTIGKLAYHLWDTKEGGRRLKEFRHLKTAQYLSDNELQQLQSERLTALLRHAHKTSPWYRPIMEQSGIDLTATTTPSDLRHLPITTKADIRNNTERFISDDYDIQTLNRAKTGGSTGVSLNLYFDERCQQWRNAAQMYADNLAGWEPGTRVAAVWGNPPVAKTPKQKLRSYLLERTIYLDTMDLNPTSMGAFVEQWKSFKPAVIFGHAHSIYIFAKFLVESGIADLRPKGVVATSMMLLDHERSVIEQAFSTKVTNRYGCEEVGLISVECEKHQGMHINSPHIILESLDANDQPVQPGEPGKLVLTDLNNYAMPLIRYRVEDVGVLSGEPCECGRTLPLLDRLEGRVADFLKKPDGGQVAGVSLVERTLTKVPGVEQMQLIQEQLHEVKIRRVKGKDFSAETDDLLIDEFREVFDESVQLIIEDVDRIPQEASGKYRFSICKV